MAKWLSIILFVAMTSAAAAVDDTPQNRAVQVDRYLTTTPPAAVFADMADKMSQGMPEDQRAAFKAVITKHLDIQALTNAMRAAMVKTFTADELSALADFYGSPIGKSAMSKMGDYMRELMPVLSQEMMKAQTAVQQEMTGK